MAREQRFDIAFGHCRVHDGGLVIERPALEALGRWATVRRGLATSFEHQPRRFGFVGGTLLLLVGLLIAVLVDVYTTSPAAAPIVVGVALLGLAAIVGPLEWRYRRARRQRQAIRRSLADEFDLRRPEYVPFEAITDVTVRTADRKGPLSNGRLLLVHYSTDGTRATTYLGFPGFMEDERATAISIFEEHGVGGPDQPC